MEDNIKERNSMQEKIEELEKELRLAINIDDIATTIRNDDAQTILSLIEKLQKENELLRKDIEGWEKYCEEIQEEQTEVNNKNCELEFDVEKLQKENEKLEDDNKYLRERETYLEKRRENIINLFQSQQTATTIPIQKIKDKIEELKKDETSKYYYMFLEDRDLENTIQVLQELLESEEK